MGETLLATSWTLQHRNLPAPKAKTKILELNILSGTLVSDWFSHLGSWHLSIFNGAGLNLYYPNHSMASSLTNWTGLCKTFHWEFRPNLVNRSSGQAPYPHPCISGFLELRFLLSRVPNPPPPPKKNKFESQNIYRHCRLVNQNTDAKESCYEIVIRLGLIH